MTKWQHKSAYAPDYACEGCQRGEQCWDCRGTGAVDCGHGIVGCACVPCKANEKPSKPTIKEIIAELTPAELGLKQAIQVQFKPDSLINDAIDKLFDTLLKERAWRLTVEDEAVMSWVESTTPKETLHRILQFNSELALDPAVSEDAQKLIERGRLEAQGAIE